LHIVNDYNPSMEPFFAQETGSQKQDELDSEFRLPLPGLGGYKV